MQFGECLLTGLRPDHDALAAGSVHRLEHQCRLAWNNPVLDRIRRGHATSSVAPARQAPIFPAWNLGVKGSLRRTEIYDDAD